MFVHMYTYKLEIKVRFVIKCLVIALRQIFWRNSRFYEISGHGLILRTAEGRVVEQKQKVF